VTGQPLDDAIAKLRRANLHIEALRADIREAGQGEPYIISLREDLDEDTRTLHLRVDRETARPERWGVTIGDALHNLRSALDNGWWQLACLHLGRAPTEEEAKRIQFPILKPEGAWNPGNHRGMVGAVATTFVGELQPDPRGYPADTWHPLAVLNRLSNVDKHRNIHTTVQMLDTLRFRVRGEGQEIPDIATGVTIHDFAGRAPKAGDEVVTLPADSWPRDPHMEFEAHQTGFVAIEGGRQSVLTILDGISSFVDSTLAGFSDIFAGRKPPKPKLVRGPKEI
jgi:hypothetical protein